MPAGRLKKYKKRSKPKQTKQSIVKSLSAPLPLKLQTNLRYVDSFVLNPGIGVLAIHQFAANDIFDPDVTGVGHQPLGRDELATFYNGYRVLASVITVSFMPHSNNSATGTQMVGIMQNQDTSVPSSVTGFFEQPDVKFGIVTNSNATGIKTIRASWSEAKIDKESRTVTAMGSSPAKLQRYSIGAGCADGTSDGSNITAVVSITYRVVFSERKDLTSS